MAFTRRTWITGEKITSDLLNRIEQALLDHDTNITNIITAGAGKSAYQTWLDLGNTGTESDFITSLRGPQGPAGTGGSGGSTLVYNTLTDLQTAYPNGANQPVWVIADQEWYYWSGTSIDTTPPIISVSPQGSTFSSVQSVTVSLNEPGTIYYTLDGTTPTTSSTIYTVPISIPSSCTLKILAKDTSGNQSTRQDIYTINVQLSPPVDVTNLVSSNISSTSLTLTWTGSSGATSYDVYNGANLVGNTASTTYNVTGLTPSTSYTFKIVAKNNGGSSLGVSLDASTTSTADTIPPNDVTGLTVGTVTDTSVPLTWTLSSSPDVANYEVAYSSDGGANYTIASNTVNPSSVSYTITGLTASTSYKIRIVAIDTSSNRSVGVTTTTTTNATQTVAYVNDSSLIWHQDNPSNGLTVPNQDNYFQSNSEFTFETTVTIPKYINIIKRMTTGATDNVIYIFRNGSNQFCASVYGKLTSTGAVNNVGVVGTTAYTDETIPYHIAVVRDATKLYVYVNNVLNGTIALTSDFVFNSPSSQTLILGDSTKSVTFKNVSYYNRALTSTELTQNYNALK